MIVKKIVGICLIFLCSGVFAQTPYSVAHRGGHIDGYIPENSVAGVRTAALYGFRSIECDVHYTSDSVLVCMHDQTINRVMRLKKGYAEIPEPVKYREVDYKTLRSKYVLASSDKKLRTPIANFDEILKACKKYGIIPMLHTDEPEAYRRAKEVLGDDGFIAFDVSYEAMVKAREISKTCKILWDPDRAPAEEVIEKIEKIGGNIGISSMKHDLFTAEYVGKVRAAGHDVQASIFNVPRDIQGIANGCNIVLSDFSLFAPEGSSAWDGAEHSQLTDRRLAPGETVTLDWSHRQYGSLQMGVYFSGKITMTVNDKHVYELDGNDVHRIDGWRFYDAAPKIIITATEPTVIKSLDVDVFTY